MLQHPLNNLRMHQNHVKRGLLCFDKNNNVHFRCNEDVLKMHQRFTKLATNRKNKPKHDHHDHQET